MGATPLAYQFDENDKITEGVKRHIWLSVVRDYLAHRKGVKIGETIKGLDYKTKYGAAMNNLSLTDLMAGELSSAAAQLFVGDSPNNSEGATRAVLGSFNLKATVTGYDKQSKRGKVEFILTNMMTKKSLTRGVSKEGYEGGAKDPGAMALSNRTGALFPNGQRDMKMTFRWSEQIVMREPER
ncbi:hypothetical protein ACIQZN_01830 [Streptomyces sp. NPDC097595]|uniref:hypothetical protein n=1 Tax=Streptomyces sp. NPDC097595 TaxID=3366090 RepID=UPI0037F5FDA8